MIEELLHQMTPGKASVLFLGVFIVLCLVRKVQVSMHIKRLGGRAPQIQFRFPYGKYIHTSKTH